MFRLPEEGRLAASVWPNHTDNATPWEREVKVLIQQPSLESLCDALHLDYNVAELLARGDVELRCAFPTFLLLGLRIE